MLEAMTIAEQVQANWDAAEAFARSQQTRLPSMMTPGEFENLVFDESGILGVATLRFLTESMLAVVSVRNAQQQAFVDATLALVAGKHRDFHATPEHRELVVRLNAMVTARTH